MRVLANAAVSAANSERGAERAVLVGKGKSRNGSQMSGENGSKRLMFRPKNPLGMIDIFVCWSS